jgi:hypothetical protein
MYTDAKRLVEPWNNNIFNSSNEPTLHHSSSGSAVMYSANKRYIDYDHNHATSRSYNTANFPAQYDPERATSSVYRSCESQRNDQNALRDNDYMNHGNHIKQNSIYSSEQSKGYYYDTHISEAGVYSHRQAKSSMYFHSTEDAHVIRNPFMDRSNLQISTMHEIPGAIESESSSLDNSFDYSDSAVSQNSKSYDDHEAVMSKRNFNLYHNDYNEGYDHFTANRYDQKRATSKGLQGATAVSHVLPLKKDTSGSGATKCKMIEVAPGEFMRLRGAHETWKAIQNDFYLPCACICCELTLFCIQDATYVLCPECQVVNPLEKIDGYDGGVGLGFTMEELAEWQNDIVTNRLF